MVATSRPRVVFWNGIPSPYIQERFNAVARRGNLDFEAWFSAKSEAGRSWRVDEREWEFEHHYVPNLLSGTRGCRLNLPVRLLHRAPDLLVSLYADPSCLLGWFVARRLGARTAFRVLRTYPSWVRRTRLKEAAKAWLFPRVDGFFVPGPDGARQVESYGGDAGRVHCVTQSVDVQHFSAQRQAQLKRRDEIRRSLNLSGTTFIYVGRLWRSKGLDYLIDAFATLQERLDGDASLLLVGDGVDEARYRRRCDKRGLRKVTFTGFVDRDALPKLHAAADVFVFPTLGDPYGLVVDEAMACSLPIITSSAAGEIRERVEEGVNGFIVPPANSKALSNRMELLARDPALRAEMGEASTRKVAGHTPERWAKDFEDGVERILAMPRV